LGEGKEGKAKTKRVAARESVTIVFHLLRPRDRINTWTRSRLGTSWVRQEGRGTDQFFLGQGGRKKEGPYEEGKGKGTDGVTVKEKKINILCELERTLGGTLKLHGGGEGWRGGFVKGGEDKANRGGGSGEGNSKLLIKKTKKKNLEEKKE